MTELPKQVTAITIHYLGPAAPVFLERQAKMHLGVHSIEKLEQKDIPNLQY